MLLGNDLVVSITVLMKVKAIYDFVGNKHWQKCEFEVKQPLLILATILPVLQLPRRWQESYPRIPSVPPMTCPVTAKTLARVVSADT